MLRGSHYEVSVKTGDRILHGAKGSVSIAFYNADVHRSDMFPLKHIFEKDYQNGELDEFHIHIEEPGFDRPVYIEIRRESDTGKPLDKWFCEFVRVRCLENQRVFMFPLHRWVREGEPLRLREFDMVLPQDTELIFERKNELWRKKKTYEAVRHQETTLLICKHLPHDERFSVNEELHLAAFGQDISDLPAAVGIFTNEFVNIKEIEKLYTPLTLPTPRGLAKWRCDKEFGYNRLVGCNPTQIRLCTEIPENFAVSADDVQPLIDGMTLKEALQKKRLFIINYEFLKDLRCNDDRKICAPMALFFLDKDKHLMPVAIQLFQDPAQDNPVFYPSDPEYTWLMAKCYFNNADASVHQSATHLGFTHLLGGGIAMATNRCLSLSHPIHRLLAPHFIYLLAINQVAFDVLIAEGGWVDQAMTIGRIGMFEIIRRKWQTWRLDVEGNLLADLKDRGVDDPEGLPNYHYRDDAILLRKAIYNYVKRIVDANYTSDEAVANDAELRDWGKFLAGDPEHEEELCLGMKGLPHNGSFQSADEITDTVTNFIFICSVGHAAANFGQYDQYAFPPNYPAWLHGEPPRNKEPLSEDDIVDRLADVKGVMKVMTITNLLSTRGTKPLGDFEIQYIHDPAGVASLHRFRADLTEIGDIIDKRNETREEPYIYLNPREVPNAISI